jgi:hypothetical protein
MVASNARVISKSEPFKVFAMNKDTPPDAPHW